MSLDYSISSIRRQPAFARLRRGGHACRYKRVSEFSSGRIQIDIGATMIEMDPYIRITLRRFNHGSVERRATDRVDMFIRVDIVLCEMQVAGFVVDHPPTHGDGVSQRFIRNTELLERVNAAC